MLRERVITAVLLLVGLLAALFLLPQGMWLVLMAVLVAGGAWEWSALANLPRGWRPAFALSLGAMSFAFGLAAGLDGGGATVRMDVLLPFYLISGLFWLLAVPLWLRNKWTLAAQGFMGGGVGFVVLLPLALALAHLRLLGPWVLLGAMAAVWVADIAAYFVGRAVGRRKLAPSISPGKSWEGVMGAAVAVTVFGLVLALLALPRVPAGPVLAALVPVLVIFTAVSVIGDLFESLLKRQAGVKDSGSLLPGHGGILDRIDSLTSTMPLAALGLMLYLTQ